MQDVVMTTDQEVAYGVTVLDKGKPPVPFTEVPPDAGIEVTSSNPAVARVEMRPDGMNFDVHSDGVGTSNITLKGTGSWASLPADTGGVIVKNAVPGSFNVTVGAPTEEADFVPSNPAPSNPSSFNPV